MKRWAVGALLFVAALAAFGSCRTREAAPPQKKDDALAARIEQLVETFLMSDDEAKQAQLLSDARGIFEHEGIPSLAKVGDAPAYGFVLMNMLGQGLEYQVQFIAKVRDAATRHELPDDALPFAEARLRQAQIEERYKSKTPSNPALRDEIVRLYKEDQAAREKVGFDFKKMEEVDGRTARPLKAILDRYGVPTYDMVGVEAAKDFVVMVQHQSPEFRSAVLPKLKANIDTGQAEPGKYAMVYDRTQRDQGKKQLYGEQLECENGKPLTEAPLDDAAHVNTRRAELGLMRIEIYERLVRHYSPDMCGAASPEK